MKNSFFILSIFFLSFVFACSNGNKNVENCKQEILNVEKAFAEMASCKGVDSAFLFFAADDAVLNRNDKIIEGKAAIKSYFINQNLKYVKLNWKPDFVDVAASCDIAYTYGKYNFSATDSSGKQIEATGIFHTIWKRQKDGNWKFVYD
jgi:ketosteroid isomerase-like protein